jgi:SMC interacting uncharacterized protein involved in chromosome segregation
MMTDIDYIMSDIRDAVGMIISDDVNLDDVVGKIRDLVEPEWDKIQEESYTHETHAENCEDTIGCLEDELEEVRDELEEAEGNSDWLQLVQMFRKAGGYVHDITYGEKARY